MIELTQDEIKSIMNKFPFLLDEETEKWLIDYARMVVVFTQLKQEKL